MLRVQEERFPGGQTVSGLIVYRRPGGLTDADRQAIAADARKAADALPLVGKPADPVVAARRRGGLRARCRCPTTTTSSPSGARTCVRRSAPARGDGLEVYVTGGLGFNADFEEVFGDLDAKVLGVTVLLVLVLLLLIYRSPLIALMPLVVVGFAYSIAQGFVYLYAKSGRDGERQRDDDPRRAHVRGGHRLLPPARLPIPRGAAPHRGQAPRDGARAAPGRPGDPRQRPDRRADDARPAAGRRRQHALARPGLGDRRRPSRSSPGCRCSRRC